MAECSCWTLEQGTEVEFPLGNTLCSMKPVPHLFAARLYVDYSSTFGHKRSLAFRNIGALSPTGTRWCYIQLASTQAMQVNQPMR